MAILDDTKAYLLSIGGTALQTKYTDAQLQEAIDVETELQSRKLKPGAFSAAITEALCRRVYVNLSRRSYALGLIEQGGDGDSRTFVMAVDQEIRRLEAPWRRLAVG
jgi:hypothetical protein